MDATAFVSLDATDCPVEEPTTETENFLPRYYSHKLHSAGLKYEIGINLRTGIMVWVFGGVPCGPWSFQAELCGTASTRRIDGRR